MIELIQISAAVRGTERLQNIDLRIPKRQTALIAGPNGSGKTTLLRIAAGDLRPSAGKALIDGAPAQKQRANAALLPQRETPIRNLSVERYLKAAAPEKKPDIERAAALFDIEPLLKRDLERLSPGESRKVEWTRMLMQDAPLLLLDEPLERLDPAAQRLALAYIEELRRAQKTILITANRPEPHESAAQYAAVLQNGRIAAQGPLEQVKPSGESWAETFRRLAQTTEQREDAPETTNKPPP